MAELKQGFESLNYTEVKTYLNSGNVIFSSDEADTIKTTSRIEEMIKNQFCLDVPVFVISKEELEDILYHAPDWWGDESKEIYDNLIFIMPPATFKDVYNEIGEPKEGLEKIEEYKESFANPYRAAQRGFVDRVILPEETRPALYQALVMTESKSELRPKRKHGIMPN